MIITKIYIKSFGRLHDLTIDCPSSGLVLIRGDNESGKSTIAAFIKFIFYGLAAKEKWDGMSERERYLSWDDGLASGYINLTDVSGTNYRIERQLLQTKRGVDTVTLSNLDSGEIIKDKKPHELFLSSLSPELFTKTCYISQHGGAAFGGKEVKAAIENILSGGDEDADSANALAILDKARVKILHKNEKGGMLFDLTQKLEGYRELRQGADEAYAKLASSKLLLEEKKGQLLTITSRSKELGDKIALSQSITRLNALKADREAAKELLALEQDYRDFINKSCPLSFTPDKGYKQEAEGLISDLSYLKKRQNELELQLEGIKGKISEVKKQLSLPAAAQEKKGEFDSLEKSVKDHKNTCILFLFLALASILLPILIRPWLFMVTALLLVPCLFFAFKINGSKRSLERIYGYARVSGREEFISLIESTPALISSLNHLKEREGEINNAISDCRERENIITSTLDRLAKKWREDIDPLRLPHLVEDFLNGQRELFEKIQIKKSAVSKTAQNSEELKEEICRLEKETGGQTVPPIPQFDLYNRIEEKKELDKTASAIREDIIDLEKSLARCRASLPDKDYLDGMIEKLTVKKEELSHTLDAVKLAADTLSQACLTARNKFAPAISSEASAICSSVVPEKYQSLSFDRDLSISFFHDSTTRQISPLSQGAKNLIYLAFRMSLTSTLFSDPPPMIWDECLAFFDDQRLSSALIAAHSYAKEKNCQIFIFSCSDRELSILNSNNHIPFVSICITKAKPISLRLHAS